jgi:hypothetical protein
MWLSICTLSFPHPQNRHYYPRVVMVHELLHACSNSYTPPSNYYTRVVIVYIAVNIADFTTYSSRQNVMLQLALV